MVETPTGKLLHVADTYTERIQGGGGFFGGNVDKAEAEHGYCVWISWSHVTFWHRPPPTPLILCSRGGGEQRAAAPSQLKLLINQCYLKRLILPRWQKACSRSAVPLLKVALWLCCFRSINTVNSCHGSCSNMQEKLHRNDGIRSLVRNLFS